MPQFIYKSISSVRSIVQELRPEDDARLEQIRWCPTQFVCFKVNPSPAYSFHENQTGQPIAAAVASYLAGDAEPESARS